MILLVVDVYSFVSLISAIGYNNENDKLHSGLLNKVPFDLLLVISALIIFVSFLIPDYVGLFSGIEHLGVLIIYVIVFSIVDLAIIMGLITTFISRLKTKTLIKNTITYQIVMLLKNIIVWFKVNKNNYRWCHQFDNCDSDCLEERGCNNVYLFLDFYFITFAYHFIKFIVLLPLVVYLAINMKQLKDGAERLANGD